MRMSRHLVKAQLSILIFLSTSVLRVISQVNVLEDFESGSLTNWTFNSGSSFWNIMQSNYSINGQSLQICYYDQVGNVIVGYNSNTLGTGRTEEISAQRKYTSTNQASNLKLVFKWRCNGEKNRDFGSVFCSSNGTQWYVLKESILSDYPDQFGEEEISLPSCMDYQNNIYIAFKFQYDESFDFQPGLVIDDLMLKGSICATPPSPPSSVGNFQTCYSDSTRFQIAVNSSTGSAYWYTSNQCEAPFAEGLSVQVMPLSDRTYYVKSRNSFGCLSATFLPVNLNVITLPVISVLQMANTTYGDDGIIEVSAVGETATIHYQWSGPDGLSSTSSIISGINEGIYNLTVTDGYGCSHSENYQIAEGSSLVIPKVITPNNDGKNDEWKIKGIEQWHDLQLFIFNQQESIVYSQELSQGEVFANWFGRDANDLPLKAGDYFYLFVSKEKSRKEKGIVSIIYE
jgi:gliding motility-associated-like protein